MPTQSTLLSTSERLSVFHVCIALLLALLAGCGFSIRRESSEVQIKALSQLFQETNVLTCSKVTIVIPPYIQAVTIINGRSTWEECMKLLYPY